MRNTVFKVGDKVRCISRSSAMGVNIGEVYTVKNPKYLDWGDNISILLNEVLSCPYEKHFELVESVLTPEEVLKHLLAGTKMEYKLDSDWCSHSGDLNLTSVQSLSSLQWRSKPEPEIIEVNGKRYKEITE